MRTLEASKKMGKKGKYPKHKIIRKPKTERKQKETTEDVENMKRMLAKWMKEAGNKEQKIGEEGRENLSRIRGAHVTKIEKQEQMDSVNTSIQKLNQKELRKEDYYETWRASRQEGRKRKPSEEHPCQVKRKKESELHGVEESKSEMGSKRNHKSNSYLTCSAREGGGGHIQGGAAGVRGGRDKAKVQGAHASLTNWLTRLGGTTSEKKAN